MTTRKPTASDDDPLDIGSMVEDFHAVEMLREHLATIGWTADYQQLEAGQLQAHLVIREAGSIALVRMAVSHRVIGSCRSPDDRFTIAMSVSKNALRINGRRLDQEGLLVIPPKTDIHVTSVGSGWSALSLLLMSVDMLAEHLESVYDDHSLVETDKIAVFDLPKQRLASFQRMVSRAMSQPLGAQTHTVEESDFVAKTSMLLMSLATVKRIGDPYGRVKKYRTVARAKEYIREHLRQGIRVTDICAYCGVSLSTLERFFKCEIGTTPNGYILAARLHEVRRELLDANSNGVTIADIAMNCGITHMGRFSRRYRAHFGRLPSEERSLVNGKT